MRMRATDWLMRSSVTFPSATALVRLVVKPVASSGIIDMSRPALTACEIASSMSVATWYLVIRFSTSCQSEITTPLKCSWPRRMSVSMRCEAWPGTPLTEPLLTITVATPASMPCANDGRWMFCSSLSSIVASVRSKPLSGAE